MRRDLKSYARHHRAVSIVLTAMLFFWISGCAVEKGALYEKDGKIYGRTDGIFKAQWDDYYLRGLSYMEGAYWEDAARDLKKAIEKRFRDQRRARTYGLHFIDYFPNRELGIACYHLGRYTRALELLERSLSFVETARTKFYLNKARKTWLEKNRLDQLPPEVSVQFPPVRHVTSDLSVPLTVQASDNYFVSGVVVNGQERAFELFEKKKQFQDDYFLKNGRNIITVQSRDILGKTSRPVTVEVCLDRAGPLVLLGATAETGGIRVKGLVYDGSGLVAVQINGKDIRSGSLKSRFVDMKVKKGTMLRFRAEDVAGNITAGTAGGFLRTEKEEPFFVEISGVKDGLTVYADSVCLQTAVFFKEDLKKVVVGGYPLCFDRDPVLADLVRTLDIKGQKYLALSRKLHLHDGNNRIRCSAQDRAGRCVNKTVRLFKKIQAVRQLSARMSLAVLPFAGEGGAGSGDPDYVVSVLATAIKAQERFNLLAPDRVRAVLRESGEGNGMDCQAAAELGASLGADAVMTGEIVRTNRSVEINGRFVDSATGKILAEKDVYFEGDSFADLRYQIDFLARKFKKHFPLCETRIVRRSADRVVIGAGVAQAVKNGMTFFAYRCADDKFPGSDSMVSGMLRVDETEQTFSSCRILKQAGNTGIRPGDRVIAK